MTLTVGSLFAGIGGMDLGFERAGFEVKWQVEIDPFCQKVLAKHWPDVPRYGDVRGLTGVELEQVDVITAGFPCQPVSRAGKRLAQADERWLWPEVARLLRVLRPRYLVVENVPGLFDAGFDEVLSDLAAGGYDTEWDCFPASAFGAYHERDRLFLVAYPAGSNGDAHGLLEASGERRTSLATGRLHRMAVATRGERENSRLECEPDVVRLVHGFPGIVGQLKALGNSVVPQVAEYIAELILDNADNTANVGAGGKP